MRKLKIGILDLVAKVPTRTLWARTMHANLASIIERIRKSLGPLWEWLPDGVLYHDPNAYFKAQKNSLTLLENAS